MERRTQDASLLLRLWIEPHDGVVRARLIASWSDGTTTAAGIDDILDAVRVRIRAFEHEELSSQD